MLTKKVDELASQCVKCGLCLPHCPTYQLSEDENESPRGRIALFQALSTEDLPLTAKVKGHLDRCLVCRACEPVCPAHVQYGELVTTGRAMINTLVAKDPLPSHGLTRLLKAIVQNKTALKTLHWVLWGLQISGIRKALEFMQIPQLLRVDNLDSLLPRVERPKNYPELQMDPPIKSGDDRTVSLFLGCINQLCDQETIDSAIKVLRHLGYNVHIPAGQNCCGAIALHEGDQKLALSLAQQNSNAFQTADNIPIIGLATGCTATLMEYNKHFSSNTNSNLTNFAHNMVDILTFIAQPSCLEKLKFKSLPLKIKLHTPCTRRNVLKSPLEPYTILSKIPELQIQFFASPYCCGAAGTYMLEHPEFAKPLVQNLLSELGDIPVDFIATSNIGCALQMQQELKDHHSNVKICHPITLIAKALDFV